MESTGLWRGKTTAIGLGNIVTMPNTQVERAAAVNINTATLPRHKNGGDLDGKKNIATSLRRKNWAKTFHVGETRSLL